MLVAVAAWLQTNLRDSDTVARIGGDEFVALIAPPCDDDLVGAVAQRLLSAVTEPVRVGPNDLLSMSASIGAVVTEMADQDAEMLLDAADGTVVAEASAPHPDGTECDP